MSKSVKTPKGTELPLINLKGKDYLMVAYRIQWFNEEVPNFVIDTNYLLLNDDQTVAQAMVTILDKEGKVTKRATATKRETKKDFSDHTEKAETSAVGRCLALLGYGTQFAVADLDEGTRLADSPLEAPKSEGGLLKPSFRKAAPKAEVETKTLPDGQVATGVTPPAAATTTTTSGWE